MKRMEEAKKRYDEVPIPEELSKRVLQEVEKADRRRKEEGVIKLSRRRALRSWQKGLVAAAAVMAVFVTALNTSTAFAQSAGELPVIGAFAKVLTFRSYETETEDDLKISVEIPSIEMIAEGTGNLADSVNEEILAMCEEFADEAVERAKEYRTAFLETGGTEEEWAAHNIEIKVWYEVKTHTDRYLSVAVTGAENWTSAYSETRYYNFDLEKGRQVGLSDLLGEDYAAVADESILSQFPEKEAESGLDYQEEAFTGVTEDTKFYINEAGNPVVVFEKYEISIWISCKYKISVFLFC